MEPFANIPLDTKANPALEPMPAPTPVATAPRPVTPPVIPAAAKPFATTTPVAPVTHPTIKPAPTTQPRPRVSIPASEVAALTSKMPAPEKSSVGPIVGVVIIVLLFVFGGLYFWGAHLNAIQERQQLPLISGDATAQ